MRTRSINYWAIALVILLLAMLAVTAGHWAEVSLMFQQVRTGLISEIGPAALMIGAMCYLVALIF